MEIGLSISEALTARFYEWENRGRGWGVFPFPVELEPEYYPFFGHFLPDLHTEDNSSSPTLLSTIADIFRKKETISPPRNEHVDIPPVAAIPYMQDHDMTAYSIAMPKGQKIQIEDMSLLLLMLSYTMHPVSFEIVGTGEAVRFQIACRNADREHVHRNIQAYFPMAVVSKYDEGLEILAEDAQTCAIDFGLADEFMRPLAMDTAQDPYIGLFAMLDHLEKGERGVIQILFKGALNAWPESIMRSVSDGASGSFFADAPDMLKLAEEKISAPLYAVCIKVAGQARTGDKAIQIAMGIGQSLIRLTSSKGNRLLMLPEHVYDNEAKVNDIFLRQSYRLGMLLNGKELATLAHFPTDEVQSSKLVRDTKKTKAAPESATGHPFILGKNVHHGAEITVSVPASLRLRHTHIIGATGTGKSTLLLSMIAQDMQQGNGIAVLDPHGDLIETILAHVPENRIQDVILIDPADADYPVGFNILSAHSEVEKDILSSDLVAAFKRLSTSWGDQMNSVFANAILAFLESKDGGTLLDLRRFLIEKPFRDAYLKTVQDPHITYYWHHEYPLFKSSSIGSILTRLDTFLRPKLIRNMVAQKKGLDFEQILDTRKILLIKLSQGLIGAENSFLLGTFFVSKMYQAAMARQAKAKADRSDFFLYIDEFQNFITPSMSYILSGARKYHLGLILAHQDMQQLQKYDTELASSVVVNAGTRICFRLGDTDAKRFAGGFSYFDAADLENLQTREAIARIEQPNFDFNLTTLPWLELEKEKADATAKAVIEHSRKAYGTPRGTVEQGLQQIPAIAVREEPEPQPVKQEPPKQPIPEAIPKVQPIVPKPETEHRLLQTQIKRLAESRGYKAVIEDTTPDGKGRVDVSLEKNGKRIACEVSITTDAVWEVHNIQKCLAAAYNEVIVCSNDSKTLERIRLESESILSPEEQKKILLFDAKEIVQYFDRQIMEEATVEKVVKGYRIKVEYDPSTPRDTKRKREGVIKAVANSMRKRK